MYSRNQSGRGREGGFRLPEHYSGVAFSRAQRAADDAPACAAGLPGPSRLPDARPLPAPQPAETCREAHPAPKNECPQTGEVGGLFGEIGQEELLLLGIIFLLAQRPGEDDTILLLLLLLLRR